MNPPAPPTKVLPTVPPPGPTIETCAKGNDTAEMARLTFSPAVPLKRICGLSPGELAVTVTDGPPGVIRVVFVALPVTLRVLDRAPTDAVTENVTAPPAVGVNVPV